MSRGIDSNSTGLLAGIQSAEDVDATVWAVQQKNSIGSLGAKISTVVRKPQSTKRQREPGGIVGVDSAIDFELDMTRESLRFWCEPILLTTKVSPLVFAPTEVRGDSYLVPSLGAIALNTLVYASGFANSRNNGFKRIAAGSAATRVIDAGSSDATKAFTAAVGGEDFNTVLQARFPGSAGNSITWVLTGDGTATVRISQIGNAVTILYNSGTSTVANVEAAIAAYALANPLTALLEVKTTGTGATVLTAAADDITIQTMTGGADSAAGLTPETTTAAQNARVEVCGVQGATSDIEIDASGRLKSTVLDFTLLGWTPGQMIYIGGALGGDMVFGAAADRGLVRLVTIAAHLVTFENAETTFTVDPGTGKTIQIFWGAFLRQVDVLDSEYNPAFVQFEEVLPALDGTDTYQYPINNIVNTATLTIPTRNKATMKLELIGTDTPEATTSRKSGCSTALLPVLTAMYNTSSDCMRLRVVRTSDDTVLIGSDDGVESLSLVIKNNVTTQNAIRYTGAWRVNVGDSEIDLTIKAALSTIEALIAPRSHEDVQIDFGFKNGDGAVMFDLPSGALGDGSLDRPNNAAVMQNLTYEANRSTVHDSTLLISMFPYLPEL